jgi:hypothetical protein
MCYVFIGVAAKSEESVPEDYFTFIQYPSKVIFSNSEFNSRIFETIFRYFGLKYFLLYLFYHMQS